MNPLTVAHALKKEEEDLLQQAGVPYHALSFTEIVPLTIDWPGGHFDYLVISSPQVVQFLLEEKPPYPHLLLVVVGEKSAARLKKAGYTVVHQAARGALLSDFFQRHCKECYLFIKGDRGGSDILTLWQHLKINYREVIAYRLLLTPYPLNVQPGALVFFSPAAIECFLQVQGIINVPVYCIGPTTAAALPQGILAKWPPKPSRLATLRLALTYFTGT